MSEASNSTLVEFRDVTYSVPAVPSPIISQLSLRVRQGETLVLLGESGCGKTTTLKLVNRLLLPTAGEVLVEGKATTDWDPISLRRRIGYVIQEGGLFPHFTVEKNVALVPRLEWDEARIRQRVSELLSLVGLPFASLFATDVREAKKPDEAKIRRRVSELLSLVGLDPGQFASRYPRELSGGQRQRVGVARALAAEPPLLLLDEPFGALDPLTRASLQREFGELAKRLGKTAIFVTHDVREALLLGTRIGLMAAGRLLLLETPENFLKSNQAQARAYLETLRLDAMSDKL
jgi:osmoprotectant transport system ATP-binding protein